MIYRPKRNNPVSGGKDREAGFSLVEMMVALVIMGIVLTAAIPSFVASGRRDAVETAAYDIQRLLSVTRQKAMAQRTRYKVVIDSPEQEVTVFHRAAGAWVADPLSGIEWRSDLTLGLSVGGSPANLDIVIEPMGTVDATDAPACFTFSNCYGDSAVVNFVRTGRIRVNS